MKRTFLFTLCTLAFFHLSARDLPNDIADNLYQLVAAEDSGSLYQLIDEGYDLPVTVSSDGYTMNLLEIFVPHQPFIYDPLVINLLDSGEPFTRESFLAMMHQSAPFPGYVYHPANASLREELTGEIISYHREKGTLQQSDIRPLIRYEQDINTILHALYRGDTETACRVLGDAFAFASVHFPQRVDGDYLYRQNTATYERSEFQYLAFIAFILDRTEFIERLYSLTPEAFERAMRSGILAAFATSLENMEFIRGLPHYDHKVFLEVAAELPDVQATIFASELLHGTMDKRDYKKQKFDPWTLLELAANHPDFARALFSELDYDYSDLLASLSEETVYKTEIDAEYLSIPLEYWIYALGTPEAINAWFLEIEREAVCIEAARSFAFNPKITDFKKLTRHLDNYFNKEDLFVHAAIHRNPRLLSWLIREKKVRFSDCTTKRISFPIEEMIPPSSLLFGSDPETVRLLIEAGMPTDIVFKTDSKFWIVNQKYASRLNVLHDGGYSIIRTPVERPLVELAAFVSGVEILEPLLDGTNTDFTQVLPPAIESDRADLVRLLHERNYPLPDFTLSMNSGNPWTLAAENRAYRVVNLWLSAKKPDPCRIDTTGLPLGLVDLFHHQGLLDTNIAIDTFTFYAKWGFDDKAFDLVHENESLRETLGQKQHRLLAIAAGSSREVLVSKLIESYPDMVPEDPFDQVDVFTNAMKGNLVGLMDILLEKNPSLVNAWDHDGKSLLAIALSLADSHYVPYLIKRGARPDWPDGRGEIVLPVILQIIHYFPDSDGLKQHMKDAGVNLKARNDERSVRLFRAIKAGDTAAALYALAQGANANTLVSSTTEGVTQTLPAIYHALDESSIHLLFHLLTLGAHPDPIAESPYSPLMLAIKNRNYTAARLLLFFGANQHRLLPPTAALHFPGYRKGMTILAWLSQSGESDTLFMKNSPGKERKKVDDDAMDFSGYTSTNTGPSSLFYAVANGNRKRVEHLKETMPDFAIRWYHKDILLAAIWAEDISAVQDLNAHGVTPDDWFLNRIIIRKILAHPELEEIYYSEPGEVGYMFTHGHYNDKVPAELAETVSVEHMETLIGKGLPIHGETPETNPAFAAARAGNFPMTRLLLEHGAHWYTPNPKTEYDYIFHDVPDAHTLAALFGFIRDRIRENQTRYRYIFEEGH